MHGKRRPKPPFVAERAVELGQAHLNVPPAAPSTLVEGVPPALDELILRLLAKRARDRLGHAEDVAAVLAELGAQDGAAAAGPRPRPYLYRPELAGRHEPLHVLEEHLSTLQGGTAGLVLIGGESGIGKTRLVLELARRAQRRRLCVVTGDCQPHLTGPLHPVRGLLQLVADRCRELGQEETERLLGRRGKILSPYEPALAGLPGQSTQPEPAELPDSAARLRLLRDLAQTLAALTHAAPTLVILDDLQWADELTLAFLLFLLDTGALADLQSLIVATVRTEEISDGLRRLLGHAAATRVDLGRLDADSVGSIVADMLAVRPSAAFVSFLARQSEGNPFFVAEYLRTAMGRELLFRDSSGWHVGAAEAPNAVYETLGLPGSIRSLIEQRLQGLPAAAWTLAEAAAVAGREADAALVSTIARSDSSFDEGIGELLRRQVLECPTPGTLRFVHDKIREVAYEQIEPAKVACLHRRAAEVLATQSLAENGPALATLGTHWARAGVADKARPCFLAAARAATARFAHQDAERLYRAHQDLVTAPDADSVAAGNELGRRVLHVQGRNVEAVAVLRHALQDAACLGDVTAREASLRNLALVHSRIGRMDEALGLYTEAARLAAARGAEREEADALNGLARVHLERGEVETGRQMFQRCLELFRKVGVRRSEGVVLGNLARLEQDFGHLEQARRLDHKPWTSSGKSVTSSPSVAC